MKRTNPFGKDIKVDTNKSKGKAPAKIAVPKDSSIKRNKGLEKIQRKLRKNAESYRKALQKARDYAEKMALQGYHLSDSMWELIHKDAPEMITDKKLKEMKKVISIGRLKQVATWDITEWRKGVYEKDVRDMKGGFLYGLVSSKARNKAIASQITPNIISQGLQTGSLDFAIESPLSYAFYEMANPDKDDPKRSEKMNRNSVKLARYVNKLIERQKQFGTVDAEFANTIWNIARIADGSGVAPKDSSPYYTNKKVKADDGTTMEYTEKTGTTADSEAQKLRFYNTVKFKTLPVKVLSLVQQAAKNPQTDPELYEEFKNSSKLAGFLKNYNKIIGQAAQATNLPTNIVRGLMWVMNTSQAWNVAKKHTYDSDQVEANWVRIGRDLQALQDLPNTRLNKLAIDSLVAEIMNEKIDVLELSRRVESILNKNGQQYKVTGSMYKSFSEDRQMMYSSGSKRGVWINPPEE